MVKKKLFKENEFWHYLVGTFLIIIGGYWLIGIFGIEKWVMNNGITGWILIFIYFLIVYITVDKTLHKVFNLK